MNLYVLPDDGVAESDLEEVERWAAQQYPFTVRRMAPLAVPETAHAPERHQWDGTMVLRAALEICPPDATRLLTITGKDLYIPMLTFIVGQAQLDGTAAIVSTARLRPEFHGFPPLRDLMLERLRKEILHEMGHTFGLTHCTDRTCAMSLSITTEHIDRKRAEMCHVCDLRVAEKLDALRLEAGAAEE